MNKSVIVMINSKLDDTSEALLKRALSTVNKCRDKTIIYGFGFPLSIVSVPA